MTSRVLIVFDATKDHSNHEIRRTVNNIRMRGGIVHPGDTITVVGVLHKILHPSKLICTVSSRLHLNGMIWGKDFESILTKPTNLWIKWFVDRFEILPSNQSNAILTLFVFFYYVELSVPRCSLVFDS